MELAGSCQLVRGYVRQAARAHARDHDVANEYGSWVRNSGAAAHSQRQILTLLVEPTVHVEEGPVMEHPLVG